MSLIESKGEKADRRGCYLMAAASAVILFVAIAVGMGWLGQVDRGKISDIPVMQNSG